VYFVIYIIDIYAFYDIYVVDINAFFNSFITILVLNDVFMYFVIYIIDIYAFYDIYVVDINAFLTHLFVFRILLRNCVVRNCVPFGAYVDIGVGRDALLHISGVFIYVFMCFLWCISVTVYDIYAFLWHLCRPMMCVLWYLHVFMSFILRVVVLDKE